MKNSFPLLTLNDGKTIPQIGYGTFKVDNDSVYQLVLSAVRCGYRHIDTAAYYRNEDGVGRALIDSGIGRKDIFLTSKVWMDDLGYDRTMKSFEESLKLLRTDYLDLYLIHWPRPLAAQSWKALEELRKSGAVRSIGVSNYNGRLLEELAAVSDVIPAVNQIERHPKLQQRDVVQYCREKGIAVEAWAPIMKGQVTGIPILMEIGKRHGKTPAQVALRWHIQQGVVVIPKTNHAPRMAENFSIFDFELSANEMNRISGLEDGSRFGFDPDEIYENGFTPRY